MTPPLRSFMTSEYANSMAEFLFFVEVTFLPNVHGSLTQDA